MAKQTNPVVLDVTGRFINNCYAGIYLGNYKNRTFAVDAVFLYEYWSIIRFTKTSEENTITLLAHCRPLNQGYKIILPRTPLKPTIFRDAHNRDNRIMLHASFYTVLSGLGFGRSLYLTIAGQQ